MKFDRSDYEQLYFLLRGTTPNRVVSSKELSKILGIVEREGQPATRRLILETMETLGVPIGANNYGYFIIRTKGQRDKYLGDLNRRISGVVRRIKAVQESYKEPGVKIIRRRD